MIAGRLSKRGLLARAGLDVEVCELGSNPGARNRSPGARIADARRRDRLERRFEEHGAGAAVGPGPARLAHADVRI